MSDRSNNNDLKFGKFSSDNNGTVKLFDQISDKASDKKNADSVDDKDKVYLTDKEVKQELSKVARDPKQNIIIISIAVLVLAVIVYYFVFKSGSSKNEDIQQKVVMPDKVFKPTSQYSEKDIPQIPKLPAPPELDTIAPPSIPDIKSEISNKLVKNNADVEQKIDIEKKFEPKAPEPKVDILEKSKENELPLLPSGENITPPLLNKISTKTDPQIEAKRRSNIIFYNNDNVLKKKDQKTSHNPSNNPTQINNTSSNGDVKKQASKGSSDLKGDFRHRGNMELLLGRGKLIDAVVESAINSDFGGEIRGIISRDVYSEGGRNILIPKGSRIFGNFSTSIDSIYGRVSVAWNGIDLTNGYSINFAAPAVDNLGRGGVQGRYDDKFKEKFANAVLQSAFNIALAKGLDVLIPPKMTSNQANNQAAIVNGMQGVVNEILLDNSLNQGAKTAQICARVLQSIQDKTSNIFLLLQNTCSNPPGSNDGERLKNVIDAVRNGGNAMLSNTDNIEETQVQKASQEAFTNVSNVIKNEIDKKVFNPTVTINQGTAIKIYINKDYLFPEEVIYKK